MNLILKNPTVIAANINREKKINQKWKFMKKVVFIAVAALMAACQANKTELVGHISRPDISPDGSKIVFVYIKDESKGAREIYSADINGENVERLTHFPKAQIKKGPVWSPNGKKIAFHADSNDGAQIFVMDANGKNLNQLTDLSGYNVEPHWSPDGNRIIFNSIPESGKVKMMMIDFDGSNVKQLFNPDGQNWYPRMNTRNEIIFTSDFDHENYYDIYIMNLDGSNIRQLTSIKSINWFPEYSPDEDKIVFHSNRDDPELSDAGDYNLYIMNTDGNELRKITDLPGQELHAKWHPSGDKLIFGWHNNGSKGLHTLDISTGEIKKINLFY